MRIDTFDHCVHLDLDGAWEFSTLSMPSRDLRQWGPRLRYTAPAQVMSDFNHVLGKPLAPFILYGSGDFHHLASLFVQRAAMKGSEFHLVSFDNHPDWDIRPPHFGCGGWINRALDLPNLGSAHVWGCGNFELQFPARLFANRKALASGRLQINGWAERQSQSVSQRFDCMTRENWRERFDIFSLSMAGKNLYITVDLDCLAGAHTNWETGLFVPDDVAWAIDLLRKRANVIAGDLCGAYSTPAYDRLMQRLAGWWDHPKLAPRALGEFNLAALRTIWLALSGHDV